MKEFREKLALVSLCLLCCWRSVGAFLYEAPDHCEWTFRDASNKQVALTCNLRTINSDFDSANLSLTQSEHTVSLDVACSDVLFFQSSISSRFFQRLYKLESLSIAYCKLTKVPTGAFLGLDKLKSLEVSTHNSDWSAVALDLQSDSLVGMPQLESLHLGQNNIWNLPERVFCPLPGLRHLNLTWNRLQDVSEVGVTGGCGAHLITLDLSGNDLVVLPESGLAGLESLRELYLQYNDVSMLADGAFLGLDALQILNVSSNRLVALPPEIFNETQGLRQLFLQNNSISVLAPGLFSSLSQLTVLDMSYNQLTSEWVSSETFHGLLRLVVLKLSHNHLAQVTMDMFHDLSALQVLDLSHNRLTILGDHVFSPLANLHRLDISFNRIYMMSSHSLSGLYVLSSLSVAHNNLTSISQEALSNCSGLRDLRLEYNHLEDVPKAVSLAASLRSLRMSHNSLTALGEGELTGLKFLRHLDMSNNRLQELCKHCLAGLDRLEVLDLSSNFFSSIPHGTFDTVTGLQLLRLDGNQLTDINGLFASLPNLLWLNVSDNEVTWFDYALIPVQLLYLDLHGNEIRDLGNYFNIRNKLLLRTLDVSHNKIETLNAASVPDSIELLFVNSNQINKISGGTFGSKTNLSMVDLYDNLLTKLDLNSIHLPPVPEERDLPEFYIGGNPIFCDCHMEWMHRVHQISGLRQHPRVMDLDKVTCTLPYPRSNENRIPFLETQASQFLCPYTSHCFALCQCCDFIACDCQMTCPVGCSCYHDDTWATNIVDCSGRNHHQLPDDIPMDATIVYLDGNEMPFLEAHHLIGRKNLRALYVNSSRIDRIQNRTFHGLTTMKILHLEDNLLAELEGYEFEHLESLHELYLQNNRLKAISNITFANLKALRVLRLDGNFIFNYPVWHLKANAELREISLGVNLWSCNCQYMVDFKNWLIRQGETVKDAKTLFCVSNATGKPGPYILESSYSCENFVATSIVQEKLENDFLQPVLITLGIFFVVLVLGVIFAMFRVRLQSGMSKKCGGLKCFPESGGSSSSGPLKDDHECRFMYDAFISYSEMDAAFVTEVLASRLENGDPSYKLCLSSRDYQTMGSYVGDFIVHSIEASRKMVLVLTKNFVDNDWCKFSLKAAHLEALRGLKNRVVVVTCGDMDDTDIDSDLAAIVKGASKFRYEDKSFWSKLNSALSHGCGGGGSSSSSNSKVKGKVPQQCFISETNYMLRKSVPVLTNHTLKEGKLIPNDPHGGSHALKQPHGTATLPPSFHRHQSSLGSSDAGGNDLDKTFVSVETTQSSLNHSYMSIDYASSTTASTGGGGGGGGGGARGSHIYATIDEMGPPVLAGPPTMHSGHPAPPSTSPSPSSSTVSSTTTAASNNPHHNQRPSSHHHSLHHHHAHHHHQHHHHPSTPQQHHHPQPQFYHQHHMQLPPQAASPPPPPPPPPPQPQEFLYEQQHHPHRPYPAIACQTHDAPIPSAVVSTAVSASYFI